MSFSPKFKSAVLALISGLLGLAVGRTSLGITQVIDFEESARQIGKQWEGEFFNWPRTNGKMLVNHTGSGTRNILSPLSPTTDDLLVFDKKYKSVVKIDSDHVVAMFRLGSPQTDAVNLWDKQQNGTFSYITYDILDESGNPVGVVIDADRDGQAELRAYFNPQNGKDSPKINYKEIFIGDRWFTVDPRDGKWGVMVSGQWREVDREGVKYRLR